MKRFLSMIWAVCLGLCITLAFSCNASKSAKGAVIGGTAGAVVGKVIGKKSGNSAAGVIIGAAVGGTAGAAIGKYMDKQAEEIENEVDNATVERVGEGILVTFDGGLLFEFGKSSLTDATKANLREMATIMNKYPDTDLTIDGHTDSKGSDELNQNLSVERANSVASFLSSLGVSRTRMNINGYGEMKPIDTNDTEAGRANNRRVEVAIVANDKLREDAEDGTIEGQ